MFSFQVWGYHVFARKFTWHFSGGCIINVVKFLRMLKLVPTIWILRGRGWRLDDKVWVIAGDKRSPQSLSPGCYYECVACISQHSFWIPLRMNGMYKTQFDHARFDPLSLVIWSRVLWPSQSTALEQKRLDLRSLSPALPNLWLLLVYM